MSSDVIKPAHETDPWIPLKPPEESHVLTLPEVRLFVQDKLDDTYCFQFPTDVKLNHKIENINQLRYSPIALYVFFKGIKLEKFSKNQYAEAFMWANKYGKRAATIMEYKGSFRIVADFECSPANLDGVIRNLNSLLWWTNLLK